MDRLERKMLHEMNRMLAMWWKYSDDIFAIWTHGKERLVKFINGINQYHPNIKFTAEWSPVSVSFLDTRLYLEEERLLTDLRVKKTDTHQYLHYQQLSPWALSAGHSL